jgi:heme/copper-type cytochrome/quinol oxidase subunit 4
MQQLTEDKRTALEHAQDWRRNALVTFVASFVVTGIAFWAVEAGYAGSVAKVALTVAFFVSWIAGVAAFICSIRIAQLSRGK